jgi:hypothetical protein
MAVTTAERWAAQLVDMMAWQMVVWLVVWWVALLGRTTVVPMGKSTAVRKVAKMVVCSVVPRVLQRVDM